MRPKEIARRVWENAHAPYSNFKVAAAITTADGAIYSGVNVENVAYPQGICAEAAAIGAMCTAGQRDISAVYIIAESPKPIPPCGGCRQKLAEFAHSDVVITMATLNGEELKMTLGELLPGAFGVEHMKKAI